jgi:hypothetical protein
VIRNGRDPAPRTAAADRDAPCQLVQGAVGDAPGRAGNQHVKIVPPRPLDRGAGSTRVNAGGAEHEPLNAVPAERVGYLGDDFTSRLP